ncbi:DUF192 domain-containing protein [Candidatus Woesearchaeota archaeon]|nr:DUF192 domain-containing protein [Candidatus Woesearchaeota archaeon]
MLIPITINNQIIQAKLCNNILTRSLGLLFTYKKSALLVSRRESKIETSIHTFFMLNSIDVIWLDKHKNILEIKTMKPFQHHIPKFKAKYVLEIPSNTIKKITKIDFKINI